MSSKELWQTISVTRASRQSMPEPDVVEAPVKPESASKDDGKLKFLEGMRGLAALYVVLGHLCSMVDPARLVGRSDTAPALMQAVTSWFAYGHLAVAIFIVISGFSLQLSLFSSGQGQVKDVRRFYLRRAQRILPTYYACLTFSMVVARLITPVLMHRYGEPFPLYLPADRVTLATHVLLIHNWSPNWMYKINGVLWSIAIESQLYVLFPLLVASVWRLGRTWTLLLTTALAVLALGAFGDAAKLYPWYLPLFVTGMIAAHLAFRPHLRIGVQPSFAFGLCVFGIILGIWTCGHTKSLPEQDACFGFAAAAAMYAMTVSPKSPVGSALGVRPLTFLGSFSYSLYLMHHPIEQVLYWLKPAKLTGVGALAYQLALSLPLIVLGAWIFSLAFERPFLPKKVRS